MTDAHPIAHNSPVASLPVIHALPEPVPVVHALPEPVYTDRKCRVEQVELAAEVCLPTIEKDCGPVALEETVVSSQESCVDVARTVCTETEETVENELCYYTYSEAEEEGEVTSVKVEYEVECEAAPAHRGAYGGPKQSQVCYNTPRLVPVTSTLALGLPRGERKCEQRPVELPRLHCQEVVERRCFQLPTSSVEPATLQKCSTKLGPPKCRKVEVKLPRQVCSRVLAAPPPAPGSHHLPAAPGPHHMLPGSHHIQGFAAHGFIDLSG